MSFSEIGTTAQRLRRAPAGRPAWRWLRRGITAQLQHGPPRPTR